MKVLVHIFVCLFALTLVLYIYIEHLNKAMEERLKIPIIKRELRELKEKNTLLQYEIDRFEHPSHLMSLSRKSEFSHLKYPIANDVLIFEAN